MGDTGISWTQKTWNPVRGCSRVSEGCRNCYAEQQAARIVRMGKGKPTAYDGLVRFVGGEPRWTGKVVLDPKALALPLRWKTGRRVFVNSMSDLFHEGLTNEQIAAVFGVMAACPQHTFQVLTKRAKRMREWFEWLVCKEPVARARPIAWAYAVEYTKELNARGAFGRKADLEEMMRPADLTWPLPNVWLGVSVENQDAADERIPELLDTPAAVRFLSCEPLIGEVSIPSYLRGTAQHTAIAAYAGLTDEPGVDQVIAGCESGPGARPCSVEWLRSLRDQCAAAGTAFYLKQATARIGDMTEADRRVPLDDAYTGASPRVGNLIPVIAAAAGSRRKPGGVIELPYLDGVQHAAFPEVTRG